jgi:hypothetical protein
LSAVAPIIQVRGLASTHKVADGFVPLIRNPDRYQLSSPQLLRKVERVATIGLDPITGFPRNERRRYDAASVAKLLDQAQEAVPARTAS